MFFVFCVVICFSCLFVILVVALCSSIFSGVCISSCFLFVIIVLVLCALCVLCSSVGFVLIVFDIVFRFFNCYLIFIIVLVFALCVC